jgi:peptide/nickel transport system permease protein
MRPTSATAGRTRSSARFAAGLFDARFLARLIGLLVFYAQLGWVSGPGRISNAYRYTIDEWSGFMLVDTLRSGDWDAFRSAVSHIALPALLLGYFSLAYIGRMTRSFMIEELGKEYVTTARMKGASEAGRCSGAMRCRTCWCRS